MRCDLSNICTTDRLIDFKKVDKENNLFRAIPGEPLPFSHLYSTFLLGLCTHAYPKPRCQFSTVHVYGKYRMTETNRTHCSLTENETSLKIIVLFQHACIHGESEGCGN